MNVNAKQLIEDRFISTGDFLYHESSRTLFQVVSKGKHDSFMVINLKHGTIDGDNLTRDELNKVYINYKLVESKNVDVDIKY